MIRVDPLHPRAMSICQSSDFQSPEGALAGRTILRFAHAFDGAGGTETYLADLDRTLLERVPMTIIQLHLTHKSSQCRSENIVGMGRIIRIALPITAPSGCQNLSVKGPATSWIASFLRDAVLYNPAVWTAIGRRWTLSRALPTRYGEARGAGAAAADCFTHHRVDLVVLHFFGSSDTEEVMREAKFAKIPVCLLNHYSNTRFRHLSVRRHVMMAAAVAGVTGLQLPRYLRREFTTLSDGVDLKFFDRNLVRSDRNPGEPPIILLPARVVREKGHLDLIYAAAELHLSGCPCTIACAGRQEPGAFFDELSAEIRRLGLTNSVRFLGPLTSEQLRDWYAAAAVVAFPTFHDEGLPRSVLEAGAMQVPVVAYATNGVVDAVGAGQTGFLVPTGSVRQLSAKLLYLLENESARSAMGKNGRRYAECRFGLRHLADRHLQFYAKVANIANHRPQGTASTVA